MDSATAGAATGPADAEHLRRRAAALAERALRLETALDPALRRLAVSNWSGPVRAAFEASLAARHAELARLAAGLRDDAERLCRDALAAELGAPGADGLVDPWR